jgi:2,4-dienoyl-CoA reductase-like NADH-dependent reductase (Old Yellow Enzyme family)
LTVPVQQNLGSIVGRSQSGPWLFEPLQLRSLTLRNRIMVAPMYQYSCVDGYATDWHLVHLGSRAVGGVGLVMAEASAGEARGGISPHDAGIWEDGHVAAWAGIARFIANQGAVLLARELLRDPYWPLHAARALGADVDYWPAQYVRARR